MDKLKEFYRKAIVGRIEALESAKKALVNHDPDALNTIRRIAHSLRGSGGTYGFAEISDAAQKVEDAPVNKLLPSLTNLLTVLKDTAHTGEYTKSQVLLVEDDPEIRYLLEVKLATDSRRIISAETGQEAEKYLQEEEFALIILDLILPDTDGRNLLIELRESNQTANTPVIVITARGGGHTQTECYALGADAFFEKPFDPEAIAAAVADKIQRQDIARTESRKDPLTGLPNRAAFTEALDRSRRLAERQNDPLSIGFIDLDHFKSINDDYGHSTGDTVLKTTTEILSEVLRQSDLIARWGGEEFVVLFPNTTAEAARAPLEKGRARLGDYDFQPDVGEPFTVTFSAGIAEVTPGDANEEVLMEVDRLLYLAKEQGRNRIITPGNMAEPAGQTTVFLAEDDDLIASVITHRLVKESFRVIHYVDGDAAWSALNEANDIDLCIFDVKLPGMDGFELLQNLRAHRRIRSVPVIMLTSMGAERDIVRGFDLGADDYMLKPFSPVELVSRVHKHLKQKSR